MNMNDTDRFSNSLSMTSEIFNETEDVRITPETRTINHGKQWIKLIGVDEIKQGASRIEYAKKACFVVRDEEVFQVFDSICPHKNVNIPSDAIDGMILKCPMHLWKFSLENGECIEKGNFTPLTKIKHKVAKGILYLWQIQPRST
jgi:nitrite reductase/ring-hydroxylating ferredoxin subunit